MMDRVLRRTHSGGDGAIARRSPTPRPSTIRRWLADDAEFATRYTAALAEQARRLAHDLIAAADRDALDPRGRRRATALRSRIAARRQWLRLIAAQAKTGHDGTPRGIPDGGIAILEKACEALITGAATDALHSEPSASWPLRGADEPDAYARDGEPDGDADDDAPSYAPEDARYRHPVAEEAHASQQSRAGDLSPPPPPASEFDEDGEPPDGRVAPRPLKKGHRLRPSLAEEEALKAKASGKPVPSGNETKSPWKPDTPTYVRFDIGGGFDVSNRRDEGTGWDTYDPLR
jgi:hypothetical protein